MRFLLFDHAMFQYIDTSKSQKLLVLLSGFFFSSLLQALAEARAAEMSSVVFLVCVHLDPSWFLDFVGMNLCMNFFHPMVDAVWFLPIVFPVPSSCLVI